MLKFNYFTVFILFLFSCNSNQNLNGVKEKNESETQKQESLFNFDFTPTGKVSIGTEIQFKIKSKNLITYDSIKININNIPFKSYKLLPNLIIWDSKKGLLGSNIIKISTFQKDKKELIEQFSINLVSDIIPKELNYKITNTYPHDKNAYTQGLFFNKGFLYEGTGLEGQSSLRKVKIENGEILKSFQLPNNIFGEGITLIKDKIVQISWQSHQGFVYEKETFNLIKKFEYPTEGWGITTLGDILIMSDGTETLHFIESNNFTEIKKIQVYDNNGPLEYINELEIINGELFANIYQTDKIAKIDISTGRVLQYLNLKNLLPDVDRYAGIDVLNGIAFDSISNRIFVTGKKWPKLFEIKIY